jgi:hypothetical protein
VLPVGWRSWGHRCGICIGARRLELFALGYGGMVRTEQVMTERDRRLGHTGSAQHILGFTHTITRHIDGLRAFKL